MLDFSVDTMDFFFSYDKYEEIASDTSNINPCNEISLDYWETSNITNVQEIFENCNNLTSFPEGYIFTPYIMVEKIDIITETEKNYVNSISSRYSVINTNTDPIAAEIDKEIINKIFNECYEERKRYKRNRME